MTANKIAKEEEYFFELSKDTFKKISIKSNIAFITIQLTIYDDLGVIRTSKQYVINQGDLSKITQHEHGIVIKSRDGEETPI